MCLALSASRLGCELLGEESWGIVVVLDLGKEEACHHDLGSKNSYIGDFEVDIPC